VSIDAPIRNHMRPSDPMPGPDRRNNLRTALILLSVAAVFFAGIIVNRMMFGS